VKVCFALALILAAVGCSGTETGNPSFDGTVGYDAYSSSPGVVALPASLTRRTSQIELDNAWLVLGDVELLPAGHCADHVDGESRVPGLGAGDHAASQAPATHSDLSSGVYCGARLPFASGTDSLPASAPSSVRDHAIVLDGTLSDGRKFELLSTTAISVAVQASGEGFPLDRSHRGVLFGFDVAKWLGELDWTSASGEDEVTIDADHNADLLHAFESRIASGVSLFRDDNDDGVLDTNPVLLASPAR
jgi:hypothetical protein